jgi:dienelactone hydrolase
MMRRAAAAFCCLLAPAAAGAPPATAARSAMPPPAMTANAPSPRHVVFDSRAAGADGKPVAIAGEWFVPEGRGPFPAVVALHGCGGLHSTAKGRRDALNARHLAMATMLVDEGYAVLFPDSLRPRGLAELCTQKPSERTLKLAHRRADALGALDWLQRQAEVRPDRIALVGWSHGGSTTLATMAKPAAAVATTDTAGTAGANGTPAGDSASRAPAAITSAADPAGAPLPSTYFRTAIAFYPGCSPYARKAARVDWLAPVAIFIGEADDWTPAAPCIALGKALHGAGQPVSVTTYAGAHHDFDNPDGRPRTRRDVPGGAKPGEGVTTAPDPDARADAYARVRRILRGALAP